jgi:glycine cleavage system H protein
MSYETPSDRRYLDSHEWIETDGDTRRVGVSEFAQAELGDVVFVELPEAGDELTAGESFGVVESIKAVSDLYAPVSGTVTAVNEALIDQPELVNEDPFGEGWMLEVDPSDPDEFEALLDADAYVDQIE